MTYILQVLIPTPAHSKLSGPLSYTSALPLVRGSIVKVPLGKREVLGVVYGQEAPGPQGTQDTPDFAYKEIISHTTGLGPLQEDWLQLVEFTAAYYQRSLGEV